MINRILESDLVLSVVDGKLRVLGPMNQLRDLEPVIRQFKAELMDMISSDWTDDDLLELFDERAAIAEFEGKLDRRTAETAAMKFVERTVGRRRCLTWSKPAMQNRIALASTKAYNKDGRQSCRTDDRVNQSHFQRN